MNGKSTDLTDSYLSSWPPLKHAWNRLKGRSNSQTPSSCNISILLYSIHFLVEDGLIVLRHYSSLSKLHSGNETPTCNFMLSCALHNNSVPTTRLFYNPFHDYVLYFPSHSFISHSARHVFSSVIYQVLPLKSIKVKHQIFLERLD